MSLLMDALKRAERARGGQPGSEDADASSVTAAFSPTDWSVPALAVGPSLSALMVTVTVSAELVVPSLAVSWKVTSVLERPAGAVNMK